MDQLFHNQFNTLLSLQNDDKYVLTDKHMDKNIEIVNMLFKNLNDINDHGFIKSIVNVILPEDTYRYDIHLSKNVKVKNLTKTKKQNLTASLFEDTSSQMIDYIQSIVDENNEPLTDDIINDILSNYRMIFKNIIDTINEPDFIWNQNFFTEAKNSVTEEIMHARFEKRGVLGIEKCPVCGSNEVTFTEKQMRRADEGSTILFQCLANSEHKWKRN
jgi:DNA-directed RNA polymerase subunit M/transcription elongation factor TFIIS